MRSGKVLKTMRIFILYTAIMSKLMIPGSGGASNSAFGLIEFPPEPIIAAGASRVAIHANDTVAQRLILNCSHKVTNGESGAWGIVGGASRGDFWRLLDITANRDRLRRSLLEWG